MAVARATVPLNRALSKLGILSRAQATRAIRAGRVSVGGRVERDPLRAVVPERARIEVDGVRGVKSPWRAIAFHKPR
ncbi:MAG TPA: S4 domain-containing protein, partial [Vicinamibacterales bacterium]|nr:S4 domain-containing protein [Vicinamibacterales bacterium]